MPIVNLTKTSEVGSGLPRIGKLHKGGKKTQVDRPGPDLDYFRMELEPQFEHLREDWSAMYGEKPEGFERVFMTYATVDEAFSTWKEEWTATTMLHRCDGEHQVVWYSQQAKAYSHSKEKCAETGPNPCACKNVGRLNLLIPEFIQEVGILGYVMVETHSINDILTVYRTLADIQRINGTLLGVPFSLGRVTKKISAPANGKRINVNKSLFYLYPDPDFTSTVLLPRLAQSGGFLSGQQAQLPAPAPLDIDEAKKLLNSGSGSRRLGASPSFELPPHPFDDDGDDTPDPEPSGPVEPTPSPTSSPTTPRTTPEQTIIGIKTVGSNLGELKTRALKEIFNNKIADMNHCFSELTSQGKLPPAMPIERALEVVKTANCPQEEISSNASPIATSAPRQLSTKIDCPTHLLEPGDIIYKCVKDSHGPQESRFEVIKNWGQVGRDFRLVLRNLKTDKEDTFMWSNGEQTLCDGPKVRAYAADPELCVPAKYNSRPMWNKQFATPMS